MRPRPTDPEKGSVFDANVFADCVWYMTKGMEATAAAAAATDPSCQVGPGELDNAPITRDRQRRTGGIAC